MRAWLGQLSDWISDRFGWPAVAIFGGVALLLGVITFAYVQWADACERAGGTVVTVGYIPQTNFTYDSKGNIVGSYTTMTPIQECKKAK